MSDSRLNVLLALIAVVSVAAGFLVGAEVQRRSHAKGEGLLPMWLKGWVAGTVAMIVVWALYFATARMLGPGE